MPLPPLSGRWCVGKPSAQTTLQFEYASLMHPLTAYTPMRHDQMLDFDAYPQWSSDFVKSIAVTQPGKGHLDTSLNPAGPAVGAKLAVALKGMSFAPTVVVSQETAPLA